MPNQFPVLTPKTPLRSGSLKFVPVADFDVDVDLPNLERRLKLFISTTDPTALPGQDAFDSDNAVRVVITHDWGSGFQGDVVVTHPGADSLADWTLTLDTSAVNFTSFWGTSRYVSDGGTSRIESSGALVWGQNDFAELFI